MSGAGQGWREVSNETLVDSPFLRVSRETVVTPTRPDGVTWMVARRKQAVVVAPRTPEGDFYLIKQERIPIRTALWEFPAGQVDGGVSPGTLVETAHRELREETGCRTADDLIPMGYYWTSAGFTDECCHLFLATNVVAGEDGNDPDEHEAILDCRAFSVGELTQMIATGEIRDANTLGLFAKLCASGRI